MIRAVFDTSVLTAAFLKRGEPNHRILQQGGKKYQLYLSEAILAETPPFEITEGKPLKEEDLERIQSKVWREKFAPRLQQKASNSA